MGTPAKLTSDLVCSPCPPGLVLAQDNHRKDKCDETTTTTDTTSTSTSTVTQFAPGISSSAATPTTIAGSKRRSVTLVLSKLDFDAVDLAVLERLLRTVLGEYQISNADEIPITFKKGSVVAEIGPDTETDADTIRDNAAGITRTVQARTSAGESKQDAPSTSTIAAEAANDGGDSGDDSSTLSVLIIIAAAAVVIVVVVVVVVCKMRARPSAIITHPAQSFNNPMYDATSPSLSNPMYGHVVDPAGAAGLGYQDVHDKPDPHAYMDVRPDPLYLDDANDSDGELAV